MATQDLTTAASAARPFGASKKFMLEKTIDFNANNYGASDVLQLFDIKAGWRVDRVGVHVEVIEDSALTLDLGDDADPNGYLSAVDAAVLGYSESSLALTEGTPNAITGYSDGKLYTADDTLDMVLSAAANAGKVHVRVEVTDFSTNT